MKRFSIAGLMLVVLVCGVAVAALRNASDTWAGVMLTLTLGLLGTALLGTLYLRGPRRAFSAGFAVFGWGYLTLALGPWFAEQIEPRLATTQALDALHARLDPPQTQAVKTVIGTGPSAMSSADSGGTPCPALRGPGREPRRRDGHPAGRRGAAEHLAGLRPAPETGGRALLRQADALAAQEPDHGLGG